MQQVCYFQTQDQLGLGPQHHTQTHKYYQE